jgi:hypothetical protein
MVVGTLFYNTLSVTRLYSVDDRVQMNDDEMETIW